MSTITLRFTNLDRVYGPGNEMEGLIADIYDANIGILEEIADKEPGFDINIEEVTDAEDQTDPATDDDPADDESGDDSDLLRS